MKWRSKTHDKQNSPAYGEAETIARRRVASLTESQMTAWGTAICAHSQMKIEKLDTSNERLDDIAEIRMSGLSIIAIADELEKREGRLL